MTTARTADLVGVPSWPVGLKIAVALAGAVAVGAAAQVALPLPNTPVPFTLQPLAVLVVGGLLGPRYGALSMVMYLAMGAAGLPVFTPVGLPGMARLFGPTGGYLLAYPVAAAVMGRLSASPRPYAAFGAALLGMAVIYAGGLSQLVVLTGDASRAFAAGILPFALSDLIKIGIAGLLVSRFQPSTRALT